MNVTTLRQDRWIIVLLLLLAVELLCALGWVSRLVPVVFNDPVTGRPQPVPPGLEPERELLLYGITCAVVLGAGFVVFVKRLRVPGMPQIIWPQVAATQACFVFLQLALAFKLITYHHPFYPVLMFENEGWIIPSVCILFGISLLSKVFWPECAALVRRFAPGVLAWRPAAGVMAAGEVVVLGLMALLLWVPDANLPVALAFWFDRLAGLDQRAGWLMGLGWDYPAVVRLLLAGALIKAAVFYGALRVWGRSFWVSVAALAWFIRWQCFYYDPNPVGWLTGFVPPLPLVLQGFDNGPMFAPLRVRQFWAFDASFAIPVVYTAVLLWAGTRLWAGERRRDLGILMTLASLGLVLFGDAVLRPSIGRYAACAWPLIPMAACGLDALIRAWPLSRRRAAGMAAALVLLLALLTNRIFLVYPNALHAHAERYSRILDIWTKAGDVSKQAALIKASVPAGEPAAVVSSLECRLLQQAGRRTMWPVLPLLRSQYPGEETMPMLRLWRKDQLDAVVAVLQSRQPEHVFMEVKLWQFGASNARPETGLGVLVQYLREHYSPAAQEGFLLMLKRND